MESRLKKCSKRKFVAGETNEIRLYGRGGNDSFYVHGKEPVAGTGSYDQPAPETIVLISLPGRYAREDKEFMIKPPKTTNSPAMGGYRSFLSKDPAVHRVNLLGFTYNV